MPKKQAKSANKVSGKMTFSDDLGRKSLMNFTIVNKKELTLEFSGGPRQEIYRRMTASEVAAYEQKIKDIVAANE